MASILNCSKGIEKSRKELGLKGESGNISGKSFMTMDGRCGRRAGVARNEETRVLQMCFFVISALKIIPCFVSLCQRPRATIFTLFVHELTNLECSKCANLFVTCITLSFEIGLL